MPIGAVVSSGPRAVSPRFAHACDATERFRIAREIRSALEKLPAGEMKVVGRVDNSYVPPLAIPSHLASGKISRRQGEFWRDEQGQLWYKDLGSNFGTQLNGQTVADFTPIKLRSGDRLVLGTVLEIQI